MPDTAAGLVGEIIAQKWPGRFVSGQLGDDVPLARPGLGLDSLEIVELAFACEERTGVPVDDSLFETATLTVGVLTRHFSAGDHPLT